MGSAFGGNRPTHPSDGVMGLLQNSMTDLEDLRTLITCRVCIRPLYEPYTISCGHTFCYTCLRQWFDRDYTNKTCPECRSKVVQEPAPAYLVRDMTQIFISRAQLLPAGETIEDHKRWQKDEADVVEKDKKNNSQRGGLFAGRFKRFRHHNASAIRDVEDGVDRCPMCAWELTEDGRCTSCAFEFDSGYPLSDSASLSGSEITEDDDDSFFAGHELGAFGSLVPNTLSPLDEAAHRGDPHSANLNHRLSRRGLNIQWGATRVIRARDYYARRSRFRSDLERSHVRSITDDEFGDSDDDTSEEDDLGSLRDFIVDEGETQDGMPMQLSPRSSHYDSDEAAGIFETLGSYSVDEQTDDQEDNDVSQENTTHGSGPGSGTNSPNIISIEDDDSDEGPVLRTRGRAYPYRRSIASPASNEIGGDILSTTRRRRNERDSRRQASGESTRSLHRSSQSSTVSGSSSTTSRAISLDSDSDHGSSPLVRHPRTRQRRSAPSHIISDDEDDAAMVSSGNTSAVSRQSSSGTMTIGRRSPARLDPGNRRDLVTVLPSIIISSSPERAIGPNPPNPEPTRGPVPRSVGSPDSRRPYRSSWRSRRPNRSSSRTQHAAVSRNTANASHSHTAQRRQQLTHERVGRQADRIFKRARTQRREREREREHASAGSGPSLAAARPEDYAWTHDSLQRPDLL